MATILLTWELGAGLGHILPLRVLGEALAARGHRVIAAMKDLAKAQTFLAGTAITAIQAPQASEGVRPFQKMNGYTHMLANVAFGDSRRLAAQFTAWNALLDAVRPDLVVTDHSPTALLALRGRAIPVANVGLAFYCPPDVFPLPFWTPAGHLPPHLQMAEDERILTQAINGLLEAQQRPRLRRLGQLYNDVDEVILATYREFDPFQVRKETRYWGHWHAATGIKPVWPDGKGPRVFAYLKAFPALEPLLTALHRLGLPSIVVAGEMASTLAPRYPKLRFETAPLNLPQVAQECDLAITNAGHGTMASLLMAGKPLLLIPLYVEQAMNAQAVTKLGAGNWMMPRDHHRVVPLLDSMLSNTGFRSGATAFAEKYRNLVPGTQIPEIVDRLEHLVSHRPT